MPVALSGRRPACAIGTSNGSQAVVAARSCSCAAVGARGLLRARSDGMSWLCQSRLKDACPDAVRLTHLARDSRAGQQPSEPLTLVPSSRITGGGIGFFSLCWSPVRSLPQHVGIEANIHEQERSTKKKLEIPSQKFRIEDSHKPLREEIFPAAGFSGCHT